MSHVAVIVGSAGQDGTLLSQLLESRGYTVIGLKRGDMDICDADAVEKLVARQKPAEIYFLAAHHHSSEDTPDNEGELLHQSMRTHFDAAVNFLNAIATRSPTSRFFYAASSHVFGVSLGGMQNEASPLQPESAYGITKVAGMMACRYYREKKGIFASVGILYNHESPLRDHRFVSRKIASAAARIAREGQGSIELGDLDAQVDWGYAPDYVEAMNRILRAERPCEYVIATGKAHTVREFAEIAFRCVGLDYRQHITSKPELLMRKNPPRIGEATRLRTDTGWTPSITFQEMVHRLVETEKRTFYEQ